MIKTKVKRSEGYIRIVAQRGSHTYTVASYSKKKRRMTGDTDYFGRLKSAIRKRK